MGTVREVGEDVASEIDRKREKFRDSDKAEVWIDRLALARELGMDNLEKKALKRLQKRGGYSESEIDALVERQGNPEQALRYWASQGATEARRAATLKTELDYKRYEDTWERQVGAGTDEILRGASSLDTRMRALGIDPSSPAYQAVYGRYLTSRDEALTGYRRQMEFNLAAAKAQSLTPQQLVDMGDTVTALQQLRQQEQDMNRNAWMSAAIAAGGAALTAATAGLAGAVLPASVGTAATAASAAAPALSAAAAGYGMGSDYAGNPISTASGYAHPYSVYGGYNYYQPQPTSPPFAP